MNNGTITAEDANTDEVAVLSITTVPGGGGTAGPIRNNNGVIQTSATGELSLLARIDQGTTGRLIADTGTFHLGNSQITGGKLESANGGVFDTVGNSLLLTDVHNLGHIDMISVGANVPTVRIGGSGLTNDGTIVVQANAAVGSGSLAFAATGELGGEGTVYLNRENDAGVRSEGIVLGTHGEDHTIRGVGYIDANLVNEGTIIAEPRNGGTILELRTLGSSTMTNNNIIRADAGGRLQLRGVRLTQDATDGRIVANGGTVELYAPTGTMPMVTGGRFETVGAGTIEVAANTWIADVTNEGVLNVPASRTLMITGSFVNNGVVTLLASGANAGALNFSGTISGDGEVVLAAPTDLGMSRWSYGNSTVTHATGHLVRGEGFIGTTNTSGTFINNGRIEGTSPTDIIEIFGTLAGSGPLKNVQVTRTHALGVGVGGTASVAVEGAYKIDGFAGKLILEIGGTAPGTQYDQVVSSDLANVMSIEPAQSVLDVRLVGGFVPSNGDVFTLLSTVGTLEGHFGTTLLPTLPGGYHWQNISTAQSIAYRAIAPFAADFDENGQVNGADLTKWRMGFGTGTMATHMQGDADEDGDVDGMDFLIWQRQLGMGTPATAVPEPAGLAVALAAVALGAVRRRGAIDCPPRH